MPSKTSSKSSVKGPGSKAKKQKVRTVHDVVPKENRTIRIQPEPGEKNAILLNTTKRSAELKPGWEKSAEIVALVAKGVIAIVEREVPVDSGPATDASSSQASEVLVPEEEHKVLK